MLGTVLRGGIREIALIRAIILIALHFARIDQNAIQFVS